MTEHINPAANKAPSAPGEFDGLSLYELSQRTPNPRATTEKDELSGRLELHSAGIKELFGSHDMPDDFISTDLNDQTSVFRMNGQRDPTLPDEFFNEMKLPNPPENFSALAIVIEDNEDGITSVRIVSEGGDNMILTSHNISTTNPTFEPVWAHPGHSTIPGNKFDVVDQDGFKKIVVQPKNGDHTSPAITIMRGDLTTREIQATNPENHAKKAKTGFGRAALLLVASTLSLASGIGAGDSDNFNYEPGVQYTELPNIDADATTRFQKAYEAKMSGDDAALELMIADSEFGKDHMDAEYFEEMAGASSITEIDKIFSEAMAASGVSGSIPAEDYDHYQAVNNSDVDAVKEAALGVLDFANAFGPLLRNNEHLKIQIVDSSNESDSDINGEDGSLGLYNKKTNLITLNLGNISNSSKDTRLTAAEVMGHEKVHDDSLREHQPTISTSNIRNINPDGAGYREDFNPSRLLEIGTEVSANHGRDNAGEDTAESFEALQKGRASPDGEIDTVLEHKLAALLSDMEEEAPGISAFMLSMQIDNSQTSKIEMVDSTLIKAAKGVRNNSRTIATWFFVAGLASASAAAYRARKASMQVKFDKTQ